MIHADGEVPDREEVPFRAEVRDSSWKTADRGACAGERGGTCVGRGRAVDLSVEGRGTERKLSRSRISQPVRSDVVKCQRSVWRSAGNDSSTACFACLLLELDMDEVH